MTDSHHRTIITAALCLAFIGLALAVRNYNYAQQNLSHSQPSPNLPTEKVVSLTPEPSFFQNTPEVVTPKPASISTQPALLSPLNRVTAAAYIVGNVKTGTIYLERRKTLVLPVASMSKLVTAIAATDSISATTTIEITPAEADVPADGSQLRAGEHFATSELLYPLLLNSSNVAAEALASSSDRGKFIDLMNGYAWEVGMSSRTFFADPTGLSPHNAATAEDFFALARYLYKYRPDILALTRTISTSTATTTDHGSHIFTNIHPFVSDPRFSGGKTGHTPEAGDTMLTILNISGQPVAFIVLGAQSNTREADTDILILETEKLLK